MTREPPPGGTPALRRFPSPLARLAERWAALVERVSLHPRLLDLSGRAPLRWVARRRSAALFDLCAGFVYAQILTACVRLDLFAALQGHPQTAADLAGRLDVPAPALQRLMEGAAALRLLHRLRDGRFRLGPLGCAVLLDPGIPAMVEHHALLYADLADPVALLRGTPREAALSPFWPYAGDERPDMAGAGATGGYTKLMAASQAMVARQVVAAFDFRPYHRLLDIGGGDGSFLRAVHAGAPHLDLSLFDLPSVAAEAGRRFAAAGLAERARFHGGDFHRDPLSPGADLVSLVRVLHDHDDAAVAGLLGRIRSLLPPGGALLIAEPMADVAGAERATDAYFGLYLLAMGRGRVRSPAELGGMLRDAGFTRIRRHPTALPLVATVLTAHVD